MPFYVLCAQDGWTPLHYAAAQGRTATAEMLLGRGASLEAVDTVNARRMLHPQAGNFPPISV